MKAFLLLLFVFGLVHLPGLAAPAFEVKDTQNRALLIELLALEGDQVTFRRLGNAQEFTLGLEKFDAASQDKIKDAAKDIKPRLPKLEPDITIGKRRRKDASWYMVKQEINCTVKLRNTHQTLAHPEAQATVVFIGQNRKDPSKYKLLATRKFAVAIAPGATSENVLKSFTTRYDSDNKGYGNVGGYQYTGYLLVLQTPDGDPILQSTADATIRKALARNLNAALTLAKMKAGVVLDSNLEPYE